MVTNLYLTCWLFAVVQVCCKLWSILVCLASYPLWFVVEVVYSSITISVLVANSKNFFKVVANPARGVLNRKT